MLWYPVLDVDRGCANDISSACFSDMANILPIILLTLALEMNYVRRSANNADPGRRVAPVFIVIIMCIAEALAFSMLVKADAPRCGLAAVWHEVHLVRRHRAGDGDRAGDAGVATAGSGLAGRGLSMRDLTRRQLLGAAGAGRSRAGRLLRADTPAPTPHYRATPSRTCSSAARHGDPSGDSAYAQLATPEPALRRHHAEGGRPVRREEDVAATVKWARRPTPRSQFAVAATTTPTPRPPPASSSAPA